MSLVKPIVIALAFLVPITTLAADEPAANEAQCGKMDAAISDMVDKESMGSLLLLANTAAASWNCRLPVTCDRVGQGVEEISRRLPMTSDDAIEFSNVGMLFLELRCGPSRLIEAFERLSKGSVQ